jgi:hypothetical protein
MPGVQDWRMIPKEEPPDYQEGYSNGGVSPSTHDTFNF